MEGWREYRGGTEGERGYLGRRGGGNWGGNDWV